MKDGLTIIMAVAAMVTNKALNNPVLQGMKTDGYQPRAAAQQGRHIAQSFLQGLQFTVKVQANR